MAVLSISCGSVQRTVLAPPPAIEGAMFVGNHVCSQCHSNLVRSFASSGHARMHFDGAAMPEESGCESCHGAGSKHAIALGGRGRFIVNPRKDPAACFNCHLDVQAEFSLPQHHPVPEGRFGCVECHDPHGAGQPRQAKQLTVARVNSVCAPCHREQTRPMMYQHEALREGCSVCHTPHGSINRKMVVEADANLCAKCHAQLPGYQCRGQSRTPLDQIFFGNKPHRDRLAQPSGSCTAAGCHQTQPVGPPCGCGLAQGSCWSGGCHSAVHGSNVNPYLLY